MFPLHLNAISHLFARSLFQKSAKKAPKSKTNESKKSKEKAVKV
jgi:hypothetical protein